LTPPQELEDLQDELGELIQESNGVTDQDDTDLLAELDRVTAGLDESGAETTSTTEPQSSESDIVDLPKVPTHDPNADSAVTAGADPVPEKAQAKQERAPVLVPAQ